MNIKYYPLKSRLQHSPLFDKEIAEFVKSVETELGGKLTPTTIDDYDCDLKLLFVQTGGSEGLFIKDFDKIKPPYYILTNGSNNSLAASLEILTYLNNRGIRGEVLHGSAKYIASRIKSAAKIFHARHKLQHCKLGVVGVPSDWLISSVPDYSEVKEKLGITLENIPLEQIERRAVQLFAETSIPDKYASLAKSDAAKSLAIYRALEETAQQHNLDGYTLRCFDLLPSLKATGCLALAECNAKNLVAVCEGDIAAMISMLIVKVVTGQSSFQANPSRINTENNTVVFAHCTVPFDMLESYRFDTHFESGIGVAVKGEMKQCDVTVFRMSADLKRYFVCGGKIIRNLDDKNLCRTQIEVQLDTPVTELLETPCGNHHIIVYGNHTEEIKNLVSYLLDCK
ncbi:MAG: hypothetical protein NC350_01615 [Corallococcus sp.]|nr:hypothetical protein [Corallococcus sp.]